MYINMPCRYCSNAICYLLSAIRYLPLPTGGVTKRPPVGIVYLLTKIVDAIHLPRYGTLPRHLALPKVQYSTSLGHCQKNQQVPYYYGSPVLKVHTVITIYLRRRSTPSIL
jgi:hypothetical protein